MNILQSKARSRDRKLEHCTKTGPSEHVTSTVQRDCPTQNGTQKRHTHSKNGPSTAPPAHADGVCRRPRSKSEKRKRERSNWSLSKHAFSTSREAARRTEGLAMMLGSGPPALEVASFDSIECSSPPFPVFFPGGSRFFGERQ